MDNLILEAVVRRLSGALPGRRLMNMARLRPLEYLLRFDSRPPECLQISLRPPHPFLHRPDIRIPLRAIAPDPFCLLVTREIEGATLRAVAKPDCDRIVELDWETATGTRRALVVELIGKSANLLLLDAGRLVLGYARDMASAFRAPAPGRPYRPPAPRKGYEGMTWDPARAAEYIDRFAVAGGTQSEAAAAFLQGLSPALGEDFLRREKGRSEPATDLAEILAAVQTGGFQPDLYAPVAVGEMLAEPGLTPGTPLLSPFPLNRPPSGVATPVPDPEEASRLLAALREALESEQRARQRLEGALRREVHRLERLAEVLTAEMAEASRAEECQRFGDLILAQADRPRRVGEFILVIDLFDPLHREVQIPADPALSPYENAEHYYRRARKLRRGAQTIPSRLESVRVALERAKEWEVALSRVRFHGELRALEETLMAAHVIQPTGRAESRRLPTSEIADQGIRKFRTRDGFIILVGKTSRDNERLTFQVAAPRDFWLHAAGRAGAHVVVRNPSRLKELPRSTLLAAAQIAAHFSRARGKGKVEVHYTLKKHVRKGRGLPPGTVTLRQHRSLEVEPGIPLSSEEGR